MTFTEYEGKRVVVTGCSSGVGYATALRLLDLGAEVIGISRREPAIGLTEFHSVDLASCDSINSAAVRIAGDIDALFNCAGAPPVLPSLEILKVNFLGPRLLTECLVDRMPPGSAIVSVSSSIAGAWRRNFDHVREFVATPGYDGGVSWYERNADLAGHGYPFSKEALTVWTLEQSRRLVKRGVRINSTSPGAVQTPMLDISERAFPQELLAATLQPIGRVSTVDEQVQPLLFLNSKGASYINGADLAVDGGHVAMMSGAGSTW
ncbi:coniferyl-alcohol dehydrogenase [Microbacterium lacus]|uniref:coniferyl-alcohol dehydrogenase n=1 Tax=Microbacterium lacus TaxID=415217 RepID=UPI00384BA304